MGGQRRTGPTKQLNAHVPTTLYDEFKFVAKKGLDNVTTGVQKLMQQAVDDYKKKNNLKRIPLPKEKA